MGQDLRDDGGLTDEGDDPHRDGAGRANQRIHLAHLLDQLHPGALRGSSGHLTEFFGSPGGGLT